LAFPIPNDVVRDYLVKTSPSDDQHVLKTNYLKFGSVFTRVNGGLEKCREELSEKQITSAEDLAKWWGQVAQLTATVAPRYGAL